MFRWLLPLLIVAAILAAPVAAQAQSHTGQPIVLAPPAALSAAPAVAVVAATSENPKGPILRFLQRRKLGLTVVNITRVLKEMKEDGTLANYQRPGADGTVEVDVSSLAVAVINRIAAEDPGAWIDWENIDWDAIIAFVEKIIELILKFLPLFL